MNGRIFVVFAAAFLSGCGYVGDPQPPALNIPARITDLKAAQQGDRIVATFTIPPLTTEGLPVRLGDVDLRIGPIAEGKAFDPAGWADSAAKVPSEPEIVGPAKEATASAPFTGKYVAVAVRIHFRKGRYSDWSNPVMMRVVAPLPIPTGLSAGNVARGVELSWKAAAPADASYRIFRQTEKDKEPVLVGKSTTTTYVDETTQYGTSYQYQVQTVVDTNSANAESEKSAALAKPMIPKDEFAPSAPVGLTAIPGISTIELSWERNTEMDLAFYRVYRLLGDGPRERVGERVQTPVFSDPKVESGKHYRYLVTAVDQVGNESQPSPAVDATAP